jgi:hypothetical protein
LQAVAYLQKLTQLRATRLLAACRIAWQINAIGLFYAAFAIINLVEAILGTRIARGSGTVARNRKTLHT